MCFDTRKSKLQPKSISGICWRKDSSKHTNQKKSRLKKIWVKVRITHSSLKAKEMMDLSFDFPPPQITGRDLPTSNNVFILYGLWPWQLSATFWLCFLEQKVYFTAATSCLFSDFILVHITPTLQRLNSLTREAERMPTPWPALGVEEEMWQVLMETSMSTLLSAKPSTLSPPYFIALGPEWRAWVKRNCFHCFTFLPKAQFTAQAKERRGG